MRPQEITSSTFNHLGPILIVDDDPGCRELISIVLSDAGYQTRVATTGKEALQLADERRPAAVISDVVLPEQSGYELCRGLREKFGETLPILLVSGMRTEPLDSVVAFLIGADDYITKPFAIEELLARVQRSVARAAASAPQNTRPSTQDLTPREYEVMGLLSAGLSQKKIAERLVISSKTVATHIQRILTKLGVHSRAEAVALAYRTGLLSGISAGEDRWDGRIAPERLSSSPNGTLDSRLAAAVVGVDSGKPRRRALRKSDRAARISLPVN